MIFQLDIFLSTSEKKDIFVINAHINIRIHTRFKVIRSNDWIVYFERTYRQNMWYACRIWLSSRCWVAYQKTKGRQDQSCPDLICKKEIRKEHEIRMVRWLNEREGRGRDGEGERENEQINRHADRQTDRQYKSNPNKDEDTFISLHI